MFLKRSFRKINNYFQSYAFSSTKFTTSKIVNCNAISLYNVVIDVNKYKDFVPLCEESYILKR